MEKRREIFQRWKKTTREPWMILFSENYGAGKCEICRGDGNEDSLTPLMQVFDDDTALMPTDEAIFFCYAHSDVPALLSALKEKDDALAKAYSAVTKLNALLDGTKADRDRWKAWRKNFAEEAAAKD